MRNKLYRFTVHNIHAYVLPCNETNILVCCKFTQLHSHQILLKLVNIWLSYCEKQKGELFLKHSVYCNYFWGRKINLSGISPAKRSRSGPIRYTWTCSGVTTCRVFWARSAHFGQNGGWDESRGARVFLCGNPEDLSATSQRPILTKFGHET